MTAAAFYDGGPKEPVHGKDMRRFDLSTVLADRMPKLRTNIDHLDVELPNAVSRSDIKKIVNHALGPAYRAMKSYEREISGDHNQVIRAWIGDEQRNLEDKVAVERPFMPLESDKIGYNRFDPDEEKKELEEEFKSYLHNLEHIKQFMGEPFTTFVNQFPPDYSFVRELISKIVTADKRLGGVYD